MEEDLIESAITETVTKKNEPLTAIYESHVVTVSGGYQHPETGFFVEIFSNKISRQSVSVWALKFNNNDYREIFFERQFGIKFARAKNIDQKKGVFKNPDTAKYLEYFINAANKIN